MYFSIHDLDATEMLPGITRRAVWLDNVMVTFFCFSEGASVPEHAHPHEQITIVTSGALAFRLDGDARVLHAGEGVCIPAGTPHAATALEPSTQAYDAWSPPRDDYRL